MENNIVECVFLQPNIKNKLAKAFKNAKEGSPEIKALYKRAEGQIKELLAKETNPEIRTLLQEIMGRAEDLRVHRIERTLARIDSIKNMCDGEFTMAKYERALIERNNVVEQRIVRLYASKIKDPVSATPAAIKEAIAKMVKYCNFTHDNSVVESVLKNTDLFSQDKEALHKKIVKDL